MGKNLSIYPQSGKLTENKRQMRKEIFMWKFRFWLAVAKMYNRLADVAIGISKFFVKRGKHGIKKHDEYYFKYVESKESKHEYLK